MTTTEDGLVHRVTDLCKMYYQNVRDTTEQFQVSFVFGAIQNGQSTAVRGRSSSGL
jgi:hypothetical protein